MFKLKQSILQAYSHYIINNFFGEPKCFVLFSLIEFNDNLMTIISKMTLDMHLAQKVEAGP